MKVTRILLADDHALVRRGVRLILDAEPDLSVVAEAGDGAEAVRARPRAGARPGRARRLDAADDRAPGGAGALARQPAPRILMLSMHDNEQYFFEALKAGACGYVLKSAADEDLVTRAGRRCGTSRSSTPASRARSCATTCSGCAAESGSRPAC